MIKGKQNRRKMRRRRFARKCLNPSGRPRLVVRKTLKHMYAVLVDDGANRVITGVSSLTPEIRDQLAGKEVGEESRSASAARLVGEAIAKKAVESGVTEVVFDRGGYIYQGKVKILADSARSAGLKF